MHRLGTRTRGLWWMVACLGAALVVHAIPAGADDPVESSARPPGPTRVMLAGDSITQGVAGDYTYRYRLWQGLRSVGSGIDLVGPRDELAGGRMNYLHPAFDTDHAALYGSTSDYHLARVAGDVAAYRPDVIVLMIGFNDLRHSRSPQDTAENVREYIERARAVDPAVDVVLGQVTTSMALASGTRLRAPETSTLNRLLAAVASDTDTAGSRVLVARTAVGWNPRIHTWDGTHPTPAGEVWLARRVAEALAAFGVLPEVPAIAPRLGWPASVVATARAGNRQVRLTWDPVRITGLQSRVRYRQVAPVAGRWVTTRWGAGGSRTLRHLKAGAAYELAVQPRRGTMTGVWSPPVVARTTGRLPRAVRVTTRRWKQRTVRVTWRPRPAADAYHISYRTFDRSGGWSGWRASNRPGARWRQLVGAGTTRVQVQVRALNGALVGPPRRITILRPD